MQPESYLNVQFSGRKKMLNQEKNGKKEQESPCKAIFVCFHIFVSQLHWKENLTCQSHSFPCFLFITLPFFLVCLFYVPPLSTGKMQ